MKSRHMLVESIIILSLIRESYWIINVRKFVKRVLYECRHCRLQFAKPLGQKMANLPQEWMTSDHRSHARELMILDCLSLNKVAVMLKDTVVSLHALRREQCI